jgi:hypothetical protein
MRELQNEGWEVHPQVGVSFFRIDLGIVHPDFPGRYLAGVECDGAAYHRSATARDRDRLREMVLTDLGWRIRRADPSVTKRSSSRLSSRAGSTTKA